MNTCITADLLKTRNVRALIFSGISYLDLDRPKQKSLKGDAIQPWQGDEKRKKWTFIQKNERDQKPKVQNA